MHGDYDGSVYEIDEIKKSMKMMTTPRFYICALMEGRMSSEATRRKMA